MVDIITQQKLNNLDRDISDSGKSINNLGTVTSRLGRTFKTIPQVSADGQALFQGIAEEQRIRGGYFKTYDSLAQANADIANIPLEATVKVDHATEGGDYRKKTAGATSLTKSAYDPLTQAKGYAEKYTDSTVLNSLRKLSFGDLTDVGTVTNNTLTAWNRITYCPIDPNSTIDLTTQAYAVNEIIAFYNIRKEKIATTLPSSNYNGVVHSKFKAPKGACFARITSVNSTHPSYTPYTFSADILKKESVQYENELILDYERFKNITTVGHRTNALATYQHTIINVLGGQVIDYKNIQATNIAPVVVLDANYDLLAEYTETSAVKKLPNSAKYVLIQTYNETHASFTNDIKSNFYFKRGYADQLLLNSTIADVREIQKQIEVLNQGGLVKYDSSNFTLNGDFSNNKRTPKIETNGIKNLYIKGIIRNTGTVLRTYDENNVMSIALMGPASGSNPYAHLLTLADNVKSFDVQFISSSHANYDVNLEPTVFLVKNPDDLTKELSKNLNMNLRDSFLVLNTHAWASLTTYDSVRLPFFPGMKLKYKINTTGGGVNIIYSDGTNERVLDNEKTLVFDKFGVITLSTFNSTHANYDPTFVATYQTTLTNDQSQVNTEQFIAATYLPTPTLKAVREMSFTDRTQRMVVQYLWQDHLNNFFVSSTLRGDKKYIFTFDPANFYGLTPSDFSMNFDKLGNIICVFRAESLALPADGHTDTVRKNPIILIKDDNYKPVVIDFGSRLKPSGWLQNCGFMCTDGFIMISEYTRPSVATANTWKASYPLTNAANWKTVQSFAIEPTSSTDGMKHIHNVERDPYTGFIYTSTGDGDLGAAIYVSKDNGETFQTVFSGLEKYCRVLNFVFMKDWIYWATDSMGSKHWVFKAPRKSTGEMDMSQVVDVSMFPVDSYATYASIFMPKINAIVFLGRSDIAAIDIPIDIWDLSTGQMKRLDVLKTLNNEPLTAGFRCECFTYVPRGNEIAVGFSKSLRGGGYENRLSLLGNTADVAKKVNNIILTIDRIGGDFTINYDTVVL